MAANNLSSASFDGPRGSAGPRRRPSEGAPVAGAPGWYVIPRTAPVGSGDSQGWLRRFGLAAGAVTVALIALLLVLWMSRAPWSGAPARQTIVVPMPALATPPRPGLVSRLAPAPNTPIEQPGRPQHGSAIAALPTKPDPALPDGFALLPLESVEGLKRSTAEWESRPLAAAPSATPSTIAGARTRLEPPPGTGPVPSDRASPQLAADPVKPGSAAEIEVVSEATTAEDRAALPAGEIRVFIHHVADQRDAALAQRLADYLRGQGFTVADIRPVDFSIGKPSVRYFFARDGAASQRLIEALRRFSEQGTSLAPDHASDFTHFVPKPRPGSVEVWLPAS